MIGTSLNQYRITASVGAGGMGEVFRARHCQMFLRMREKNSICRKAKSKTNMLTAPE
jgi:hypothetical protein